MEFKKQGSTSCGDVINRYKINLTMPVPQNLQYWQILMWPSIKSFSYPHFWDRFACAMVRDPIVLIILILFMVT